MKSDKDLIIILRNHWLKVVPHKTPFNIYRFKRPGKTRLFVGLCELAHHLHTDSIITTGELHAIKDILKLYRSTSAPKNFTHGYWFAIPGDSYTEAHHQRLEFLNQIIDDLKD